MERDILYKDEYYKILGAVWKCTEPWVAVFWNQFIKKRWQLNSSIGISLLNAKKNILYPTKGLLCPELIKLTFFVTIALSLS